MSPVPQDDLQPQANSEDEDFIYRTSPPSHDTLQEPDAISPSAMHMEGRAVKENEWNALDVELPTPALANVETGKSYERGGRAVGVV